MERPEGGGEPGRQIARDAGSGSCVDRERAPHEREDGGGGEQVEREVAGVERARVVAAHAALEGVGRLQQRPVGGAERRGEAGGRGGGVVEDVGAIVPDEAGIEHREERERDETGERGDGEAAPDTVREIGIVPPGSDQRKPSFLEKRTGAGA